jgi:hypothetical protein
MPTLRNVDQEPVSFSRDFIFQGVQSVLREATDFLAKNPPVEKV